MAITSAFRTLKNISKAYLQGGRYDKLLTFQKDALERAAEQLWEMHGGLEYDADVRARTARPEKMPDQARSIYAISLFSHAKTASEDPVEFAQDLIKRVRVHEPRIKRILPSIGADYNRYREYQIRDYIHRHETDHAATTLDTVEKSIIKVEEQIAKTERVYQRRNRRPKNDANTRKWQKIRACIWASGPEMAIINAKIFADRYRKLVSAADAKPETPEVTPTFKKAAKLIFTDTVAPTPETPLEIITHIRDTALAAYTDQDQNIKAQHVTITGLKNGLDDLELVSMEIADRRDTIIQTLLPLIDERQKLVSEIQQYKPLFADPSAEELATLKAVYKGQSVETQQEPQKIAKEAKIYTAKTDDIAHFLDSDDQALRALAVETKEIRELIAATAPELDKLREEDADLSAAWKKLQKKNVTDQKEVTRLASLLNAVETEQPQLQARHNAIVQTNSGARVTAHTASSLTL